MSTKSEQAVLQLVEKMQPDRMNLEQVAACATLVELADKLPKSALRDMTEKISFIVRVLKARETR